ncbi:MAG TPA: BTAD domain-containing putative transcriptional regulator [Actinocrinis sp.]|nr:BTAD domain-containing putative transcriptional regulator [Actinocrinis sp.]
MEFLVLGSLEIRRGGEPIQVPGQRQRKLLALLILNANRVVPMDVLVDALWEDPPQSARPQVHNAIRDLRRVLSVAGEGRIVTADVGYRLVVAEDSVDAHLFAVRTRAARTAERSGRIEEAIGHLQSAVELWRGDALAGIQCSAVAAATVKLNEQRLAAVEDLMALRLRAGESASLVGELQSLLAQSPLRESLRASLMTALHRSGRQAEALAVYDEGRRHLAQELGLDPGHALQTLHAQILAGAAGAEAERAAPPSRPAPAAAPGSANYLPHDLADFTGRQAETRLALELSERGYGNVPGMISIDGMGGVGKTSFAIHFAHQVAPDYPDGQYFIELHGTSATREPLAPAQALGILLQAGGMSPEAIPAGLEERSALWRSRLAGQRCLVILDDAWDTAQIRPLLPGTGGTLVLVTSRRKLTALDGADPLFLDVFPPADALALFTRIAGERRVAPEAAQAARVVELCGYLPLAVRIAAARLRDRSAWSVAHLADRLASQPRRIRFLQTFDRDLMSMLRASYRNLDPCQRRFSRLISLHTAPHFDVDRAAVITGMPVDDVERCLDVLLENNLVTQDAPGRFSFHDLVRDCTMELLVEGGILREEGLLQAEPGAAPHPPALVG